MDETITINSLPTATTVDGVADILPIYTSSLTATQGINRNTYLGLASGPVGLTDTQTLTNKTFTSPTISGPTLSGTVIGTYTLGGTPTFPSSVVTLTSTSTLTNKTLVGPVIGSPTITNASLSADVITGYTTSNTGTIYGLTVTTGNLSLPGTLTVTGNTILSSTLTTGGFITGTPPVWQYLGYAQITSNATQTSSTPTAVTGLSIGVTVPSGVTKVRVTAWTGVLNNSTANDYSTLSIWSGATSGTLTTQLATANIQAATSSGGQEMPCTCIAIIAPSAGAVYYTAALNITSGGTATMSASSTSPAFILVECC
jgi:hypothetical protein